MKHPEDASTDVGSSDEASDWPVGRNQLKCTPVGKEMTVGQVEKGLEAMLHLASLEAADGRSPIHQTSFQSLAKAREDPST